MKLGGNMAVKEILKFGSPKLKRMSKRVHNIDKEVINTVQQGLGLQLHKLESLKE
jgi:peptide deformylase